MKLRQILCGLAPLTLLATSTLVPLTSCGSTKKSKPKTKSVEIRTTPIYVFDNTTASYKALPMEYSQQIYHFNGSEIGYINIEKYVNTQMCFSTLYPNSKYADYSATTENEIVTITNKFNNATCKIDYNKQKLIYSDFDAYQLFQTKVTDPLAAGMAGSEKYFASMSSKYTPGKEITIDLLNYDIGIYLYQDSIFVPITILRNMLNPNPAYLLFYNGKGLYQILNANSDAIIAIYKTATADATTLTVEYLQHLYDVLALTLDNRFGMVERKSRVTDGKVITFLPNGAYKALDPYHDRLISLDKDVRNRALLEFFRTELDDGGHTCYTGLDLLSASTYEGILSAGEEAQNTLITGGKCAISRQAAKYDAVSYWNDENRGDYPAAAEAGADNYYEEYEVDNKKTGQKETVAYITFDEFSQIKSTEVLDPAEQTVGRELQEYTTNENCWRNTFRMTMWANKKIKEHSVKNIVLDLTNNGGGLVGAEHFIASWLCNGVTEKIYNPKTNAYSEYIVKADIDGDGQFTTNDYIGDDVQVYVITSNKSFSCGNALPCNLADNRPSTYFIGEQSGGGACWVLPSIELGLGDVFQASSTMHLLRNESSYNNYVSSDPGVAVNYYINAHDDTARARLYNRNNINDKIVNGL